MLMEIHVLSVAGCHGKTLLRITQLTINSELMFLWRQRAKIRKMSHILNLKIVIFTTIKICSILNKYVNVMWVFIFICRSICLLMQAALPCFLVGSGPGTMTLRGGTNAEMAPQIDYTLMVNMSCVTSKPVFGVLIRSDTNQAVQPQRLVRCFKFWIKSL